MLEFKYLPTRLAKILKSLLQRHTYWLYFWISDGQWRFLSTFFGFFFLLEIRCKDLLFSSVSNTRMISNFCICTQCESMYFVRFEKIWSTFFNSFYSLTQEITQ
jgi:hypothetical protein